MKGGEGEFDLEEWTDDLLDQLIEVEEQFVSVTQHRPPPPPPPQQHSSTHSPPRQFSQKLPTKQYDHFSNAPSTSRSDVTVSSPINNNNTTFDAKQQEIDSLKVTLTRTT